jgi:hypothetical protein
LYNPTPIISSSKKNTKHYRNGKAIAAYTYEIEKLNIGGVVLVAA